MTLRELRYLAGGEFEMKTRGVTNSNAMNASRAMLGPALSATEARDPGHLLREIWLARICTVELIRGAMGWKKLKGAPNLGKKTKDVRSQNNRLV